MEPQRTSHKRIWWIAGIVSMGVAVGCAVISYVTYPPLPDAWRDVKAGMLRSEAIAILGEPTHDLRDLKGFDVYHYEPNSREYWQLSMYYVNGHPETIRDVWVRFVDRNDGWRAINEQNPGDTFFDEYRE